MPIITFLMVLNAKAQTDTAISFIEIVQVEGASKEQLFQRARVWFAENFKDSKSVLQISDKETGELFAKGSFTSHYKFRMTNRDWTNRGVYYFTLRVIVKDGRYKYSLTDINHFGDYNDYGNIVEGNKMGLITSATSTNKKISMVSPKKMNEVYVAVKESGINAANNTILNLKSAMVKNTVGDDF
jgi:hypothetical protein